MRVLMVNKFHWRKGGSETYYFSLAEGLMELGHEVHFFSMRDERNESCGDAEFFVTNRDYNGTTSPIKKIGAAASLIYSPEAKRKFQALCEKVRPDVVHLNLVHRQITLSILDAPYLREHRVPVVYTAHDYILVCPNYLMLDGSGKLCDACIEGGPRNCVERRCVKGSFVKSLLAAAEAEFLSLHRSYDKIDCIVAPSQFLASKLVQGGFDSAKIVVMRNFILAERSDSVEMHLSDEVSERPYFLYFGRLSQEKGVDLLIDAFSSVSARLSNWELVIAGDGPALDALKSRVPDSAEARIRFLGHQSGESLSRLVSGASFACVCSRWYENMPYSVLEALAAGVPVIGANLGGIPEIVLDGSTGFLCAPDDVESLGDALMRAARTKDDPAGYEEMRKRCRKLIMDTCNKDAYVKRLVELYQSLKSKRSINE